MRKDMKNLMDQSDEKKTQRIKYLWGVARRQLLKVRFLKRYK
jgi:hypothetical protein